MKKSRTRDPILVVLNLGVQRGGTVILEDVNWRVDPGQHWVILGANGSGKTSLLSALAGYLTPTTGEIQLLGRQYGESDWRDLRRHIGIVSSSVRQMMADDEPALDSVLSGKYAIIDFRGRPASGDRAAARKILGRIECGHLEDRPWGVLSQGERQRILIGRALMAKPHLMILDEPCAGLDPAAREHFLQFLQRFGRERNAPTLVLVTHHVEEVMPVFSHVLVLKQARVLASGAKRKLLHARVLSEAFSCGLDLSVERGRYALRVRPSPGSLV